MVFVTDETLDPDWSAHVQRMRTRFPSWPDGFPLSALLSRYLLGRVRGQLNISGRPEDPPRHPEALEDDAPFVVLDDADGSMTATVLSLTRGAVTVYSDFLPRAQAMRESSADSRVSVRPLPGFPPHISSGLDVRGGRPAKAVLVSPKAQAAVADYAQALRPVADELIVIGRDKHLFRGINDELAREFSRVDVSPGKYKSRMIIGSNAGGGLDTQTAEVQPKRTLRSGEGTGVPGCPDLEVSAYGACFGGTSIDDGSVLLLRAVSGRAGNPDSPEAPAGFARILDLGCGNGWLLTAAAHVLGAERAVGVDASAAALASAELTAQAGMPGGVDWAIEYSDAGEGLAQQAFDLVLLNPPFHAGHALETDTAHRMMRSAHAVLRPGGLAAVVFNSSLRYRRDLEDVFGRANVQQLARDRRFTILAAAKQ